MTLADARARLATLGLQVRVLQVEAAAQRNQVVRQTPEPGMAFERGDAVTLFVSRGAQAARPEPTVEVPGVVGLAASDAARALREAGLVARIRLVDASQRAGVVLRQSPASGADVEDGTAVRIDVARDRPPVPAPVEVPDVRGTDIADARGRLSALGFAVRVSRTPSGHPEGTVIGQSPRAGADVKKGGTVMLTVSAGPDLVDVPDVTGLDEESARLELETAGFQVRVASEPTTDPAQDGVVIRQTPLGGSNAGEGAVVTLVVGRLA
jgi:serine/threonine-protein kinase